MIVFALLCAGSFFAATDSLNDEHWNPAFWGGPVIALMAPISLFILNRRFSLLIKIPLSLVVFVIFVIMAVMGTMGLVYYVSRSSLDW